MQKPVFLWMIERLVEWLWTYIYRLSCVILGTKPGIFVDDWKAGWTVVTLYLPVILCNPLSKNRYFCGWLKGWLDGCVQILALSSILFFNRRRRRWQAKQTTKSFYTTASIKSSVAEIWGPFGPISRRFGASFELFGSLSFIFKISALLCNGNYVLFRPFFFVLPS